MKDAGSRNLGKSFLRHSVVVCRSCRAFELLSSHARSSAFLPSRRHRFFFFFFSFLQKCQRSGSKLARSSPLIQHKTPLPPSLRPSLRRPLCRTVVPSLAPPSRTWVPCTLPLSLFQVLLTHHSLSGLRGHTNRMSAKKFDFWTPYPPCPHLATDLPSSARE